MLSTWLKLLFRGALASAETTITRVNHNAVLKDLASRAELSGSYLLMIVFSGLVALLGLLINNVAVVIGAMLISPLMGPIFTAAMAFSLGDLGLAKRALKIIVASIILTVVMAAFFTLLSPLKTPTTEILSRTRPNVYDLLIAAIAGAAGAYALCTRVSYLFVTTGVAVATAVIPPLSVVGYGFGTGHFAIAFGGFLLFFTNLVAIVISSDIVFHFFRFRAIVSDETRYPVRTRVLILGSVLVLISAPLVYTLVVDINKINLTHRIERIMKRHLDRKDYSRMTGCSFQHGQAGLTVAASVNTVKYYDGSMEKRIEDDLRTILKRQVSLDLEQVIVKPGRVEHLVPSLHTPVIVSPPPQETLATLRQRALKRVREGCKDVQPFIQPYEIMQCDIRFSEHNAPMTVMMTIGRDYPFSDEERRWLKVALEKYLGETLSLELETVPFLPPLIIDPDGTLDEASRKALAVLKQFSVPGGEQRFRITAPRHHATSGAQIKQNFATIRDYLIKGVGIPSTAISQGSEDGSDFRVRVSPK